MLPPNLARVHFMGLKNEQTTLALCQQIPALNRLFYYFERTYLTNGQGFPIRMWNVFHRDMDTRTNNAMESFHHKWNTRVATKHPNLWLFIRYLKDRQVTTDRIADRADRGEPGAPRRRKWRVLERRLQRLKDRLVGPLGRRARMTLNHYWNAVSHVMREF